MQGHTFKVVAFSLLAFVALGCSRQLAGNARQLQGKVSFEGREATAFGASERTQLFPSRHAEVRAIGENNQTVGKGYTSFDGTFSISVHGRVDFIEVRAKATVGGSSYSVSRDAIGAHVHAARVPVSGDFVSVHFSDDIDREMSGALHILYSVVAGVLEANRWGQQRLPSLFVHWNPGETAQWSYYWGENPVGSGRHRVELLASDNEHRTHEDTDEHDETIVLHEFAHFVFREWSTDSSSGGYHPAGYLVEPGLAWEEGRASWFAATVRRSESYTDTVGIQPHGRLRLDYDFENHGREEGELLSFGSEPTVAAVLWDLADGAEGIVDSDDDGIALGPSTLLQSMIRLKEMPGAHPSLPSFLRFLIEDSQITESRLRDFLQKKGYPSSLLDSQWPKKVAVNSVARGRIDGLSFPAPSGGPAYPENGMDAVHTFQTEIPQKGWLECRLSIAGTGKTTDRTNLDIEVREPGAETFVTATSNNPEEVIRIPVSKGHRMIYVRDHGDGNRANYRLEVRFSPEKQDA